MGAIFRAPRLRDPRVVPTEDVEVDWSHPLAFDWAIIPGSVFGQQPIGGPTAMMTPASSAYVLASSSVGPAADGRAASSYLSVPAAAMMTDATKGVSLFFLSESHGIAANNPTLLGLGYDASMSNNTMVMAIFNNSNNSLVLAGSGWEADSSPVSLPSSGPLAAGATWFNASTTPSLYMNGASVGATLHGSSPGFTLGTAPTIFFNGDPNSGGRNTDQLAAAGYWYRRVLSTDEHAWLYAEPFAMLRPKTRRRFYIVPAGATTLSPAAGSLALLGSAPGVEIGRTVAPGLGTIDLSGLAPIAEIGVTVAPAGGSLSISGEAPAVQIGVTAAPASGTIALAGETPVAEIGVSVAPGAGSLDLAGEVPTIEIGVTEAPPAGAIALQGQTPTVSLGGTPLTVSPGAGALDLSGATPTVQIGVQVAPATGLLSLDGAVPVVLRGVTISPAQGDMAIAGATPVIVIGGLMIPTEIVVFAAPLDSVAFAAPTDRVQFATPTDTVVF